MKEIVVIIGSTAVFKGLIVLEILLVVVMLIMSYQLYLMTETVKEMRDEWPIKLEHIHRQLDSIRFK